LLREKSTKIAQVEEGLHWLASRRSPFIFEYCVEKTPMRTQLAKPGIKAIDGFITVREEPRLGIELDDEAKNRYRMR